jgi:hypothetical protein
MDALREILDRNDIRMDMKAIEAELKALEAAQAEQQRNAAVAKEQASRQEEARRQSAREREEESQRHKPVVMEDPLDWTDRGGMVAQQGSALRAVRDHAAKLPLGLTNSPNVAPSCEPGEVTDARAEQLARLQNMFAPKADNEKELDPDHSHTPRRGGRGRTR